MAHVTATQQLAWLLDRADRIGVSLGTDENPSAQVVGREVRRFRRRGSTVTLGTATYAGQLTVTSADALRSALTGGIGRAKAYGCGLMTLARS